MILRITKFTILMLLFLTSFSLAKDSFIAGKALYLDNIPLPQNSVLTVVLEDISLMDTAAIVLGETVIEKSGQIPIEFKITFDAEDVKLGHSYAVRAKITKNSKLLYVSDTIKRVFAGQDDEKIDIVLKRVYKIPKSHEMEGMYKYMTDGGIFKECVTGKYYPVAFEEDNMKLKEAYMKKTNGSAEYIKVKIKGKIVKRATMEKKGEESVLQVIRFIGVEGKENCYEKQSNVHIANNYWKLVLLYDKKVEVQDNKSEPHILLRKGIHGVGELKVVSSCNIFKGNYRVEGEEIDFKLKEYNSQKECHSGNIEDEFLNMLKDAKYWTIKGEKLNLLDDRDNILAEFKAIFF
jgi:uncharacterized lipoprotein YbaY/heat shock protein HslJ